MKNISLLDLLKNLALSLALSAFALIPAHAQLPSGTIVSADGGTLSNEYLNVSCIVSNSHFGE